MAQASENHAADPSFGLKISPAAILRSLLQQYPSGGQFFLEALQNADDTGRATKCCAMLDLRKHPTKKMRAPQENRATLQNESILFYDDAGFSERDWKSLQFMCDSQKRHTVHEAGAFGMGSRSFFHITDVLQVLSRAKLSALDPDELLESGHFGEQVDFVQEGLLRKYPDECSPFQGTFGCDMSKEFPGTMIRASLRTPARAKACSFCPHPFDLSRAERIFKEFEEALSNGEVILFLTGVRIVELWRWEPAAKEPTLIARTQLGVSSGHTLPEQISSPKEMRGFLERFKNAEEPFKELQKALLAPGAAPPRLLDVVDMSTEFATTGVKITSKKWLRYGSFSTDPETVRLGVACSSVPMVHLALPVSGEAAEGRVFTLLPLPMVTGLPVHLNACFRLHDNRRALWRLTKDLEGEHHVWASWNERVLTTFVPRVYAEALTFLASADGVAVDYGQCAWPRETQTERDFQTILDPLVTALGERAVLVAANGRLVKPGDAVFFPTPTSALQTCRKELLNLCIESGVMAVDPSQHVVAFLETRRALTVKETKWALKDVLIPAAPKLASTQRTRLLLAFLEWASGWPEAEILDLRGRLAGIEWVPTEDGQPRTVEESFDPAQSPEGLGVVAERRAKLDEAMAEVGVKSDPVWRVLRLCGIKKEITWEDAVFEAMEVVRTKDIARGGRLFAHLNRQHSHMKGGRASALKVLKEAKWVPARGPAKSPGDEPTELLSLQDIFPHGAQKVVWAVAPSLCVGAEPTFAELKPARTLEGEPSVLVDQLCAVAESSASFGPLVQHLRAVFGSLSHAATVTQVIIPTSERLKGAKLASLLLTFVEWVGSWKEADIKDLAKQLADIKWVPVEDGSNRAMGDSFDPASSPEVFKVVQERRTKVTAPLEDAKLNAEAVWRVLHICGVKKELTWEDAVEEAEAVAKDGDVARAAQLFQHLDKRSSQIRGGRAAALKQLQALAWVPATAPSMDPEGQKASQLLKLQDVYLPSAHKVVWAVAPTLAIEGDPNTQELRPGKKIEADPTVLVQQLGKLADCTASSGGKKKPLTPSAAAKHMVAVFSSLTSARTISEVVLPAAGRLEGEQRTGVVLAFLEWVGSWADAEIKDLGRKLASLKCLPVEDGTVRAIGEAFDPSNSPAVFAVVRERRAKAEPLIKELGLKAEVVWRVLHLCELKREITWEDAVEEAESVVRDKDLQRAGQLYAHIDRNHGQLTGKRAAALERLQALAWLPAAEPAKDPAATQATKLRLLKELFPPSARRLVWAVAPSLCAEAETRIHELKPGRSIEAEPAILVEQVRNVTTSASKPAAVLEHLRAVFGALTPARILAEVVIPAVGGLKGEKLSGFLLAFLEWAGSWKEADIKELSQKLASVSWIPSEDGTMRTVTESFDPENSPEAFNVVRTRRAKISTMLADAGVKADAVWRVLRLCGIKQEITWEDAVAEAEAVVKDKDFARAGQLFVHLNKQHAKLTGKRVAALEKLQVLAWVPATQPAADPSAMQARQLLALKGVFMPAERKFVWAVAPSLCAEVDNLLHELRPGRSIEKEPQILVDQVKSLATSSTVANGTLLEHLRAVFGALQPNRIVSEVVLPAAKALKEGRLAAFLLTFLEWASSWKEADIKEVGRKLAEVKWVPTQGTSPSKPGAAAKGGALQSIAETFDPEDSPESFSVVQARRAQLAPLIEECSVRGDAVWRVMRLCGMKREITWEDAVEEAEAVVRDQDLERAGKLFTHVDKQHAKLTGGRADALKKLQELAWVPAKAQSTDSKAKPTTRLAAIKDLFPASQRELVWAVAASLDVSIEPTLHELTPGRNVEKEPGILVDQVRQLAEKPPSADTLTHLHLTFAALAPARVLKEVVLPATPSLSGERLASLFLALLEWAGAWKDTEIKELGRQLAGVAWLPGQDGKARAITECFDPEESPEDFSLVKDRRAKVGHLISGAGLKSDVAWRVLRLCGVKKELTWEDAVEEAQAVVKDKDYARAAKLMAYINKTHDRLTGERAATLEKLQKLAWVPATTPSSKPGERTASQFLALKDVFPSEDHKLIWAVAPAMCVDPTPTLQELKPGRKIQAEMKTLVEQVRVLVKEKPDVSHLRAVFGAAAPPQILTEVVLPVVTALPATAAALLLAFLEWAGSLKEAEIREIGNQLAAVKWVPTVGGTVLDIRSCFDPEESPEIFSLVRERRAKVGELITGAGVRSDAVWRVLRLCGIKRDISWEDAVEEAEAAVKDNDFARAGQLFAHIDKRHGQLVGARAAALEKLKTLEWVPAIAPGQEPGEEGANHFAALKELFPPSARKLVWAVAPSLCVETAPTLHELMPGRNVKDEPDILVQQVRALVDTAMESKREPPCVSLQTLEHLRDVFQALVPLLEKLSCATLADHPLLKGIPFMPCLPPDDDSGAALFPARRSAFHAQHNHRALSPAIGVVKPMDYTIKMLAEAAGVPKEPRAEVLAEVLCSQGEDDNPDLAVTLAIELAGRIRAKEEKPACIMVPTSTGTVQRVEEVYIDDAPWQQGDISRLHPRISAEDGRLLGCTSVRAELIRQCEDDTVAAGLSIDAGSAADGAKDRAAAMEGDTFGQEADLVSQVMQLLQEYGDSADLVKEFVQNADDAGAESLAFYIMDDSFGTERLVDPRTSALQGPALYICTDNALTNEDIARMQNVGRSKKRLDFSSSGRFGVGMNVMYRYCDCPQLLANSRLHYFDLTRSYVSQPGASRGRKFTTDKLKSNFPDSYAPFESGCAGKFPTVFRLALRTERSELGLQQKLESVTAELKRSAAIAEKMLLFTRNLTQLEFYEGDELISVHRATIQKQDELNAFFKEVPASPLDLPDGKMLSHRTTKTITMESPDGSFVCEWAIAHRIGITDAKMREILKEQLERPFGVALYPHGATAVRIKPFEEEERCGRICVGLPTPFKTNSAAWIHGGFALLSSRKALPLPEENEREPSLDKSWNKMLLEGVIAESMHQLIVYCCSQVIFSGMKLDDFLSVFPVRGDRLQTILARSTWKASLKSAVYPVFRGSTGKVTWAQGPRPTFSCDELPDDLQKSLVEDGLKLASLPDELMLEYEEALGGPRTKLGGLELCQFLKEAWEKLHADEVAATKVVTGDGAKAEKTGDVVAAEFDLENSGMLSLADSGHIVKMLAFAAKFFWADHLEKNKKGGWHLHKFSLQDYLDQVPLLLTHAKQITAFSTGNVKFNSWRDILPTKPGLFIDKECHRAIVDAVDTTAEGISREVKIDIPGVRAFTLTDLLPFRSEVESSINPKVNFASGENQVLRQFWSLVADSALTESAATDVAEKLKLETSVAAGNQKWHKLVEEWPVLPVCFCDGEGENGEGIVPLHAAGSVVAVSLVAQDPEVVKSLTGILKQCGVATLQQELLSDERIARVVSPLLVTTNKGLLQVLSDSRTDMEALSGAQRHELLAYFSVLSVKGGVELDEVAKLPLFKTADPKNSTFVALKKDLTHCCVDPADKHSNALCKLTPPGMVLLAWPTAQGKPIYEYCGVKLCSGEEFMVSYIIPELPGICAKDVDGSTSAPYLAELHAYVCIDGSDRVKKAASDCDFAPSEDMSTTAMPSAYVSTAVGAAKVFAGVLRAYLPAKWMQQNARHMELLHALGMSSTLSPTMILLCARHLHQAFTGEASAAAAKADGTVAKAEDPGEKGEKRKALEAKAKPKAIAPKAKAQAKALDEGEMEEEEKEEGEENEGEEKEKEADEEAEEEDGAEKEPPAKKKKKSGKEEEDEDAGEEAEEEEKEKEDEEEAPEAEEKEDLALVPIGGGTKPAAAAEKTRETKQAPKGIVTDSLRAMSFEIVEEFARAAEEVWPKPGAVRSALNDPSQKNNLHDMWSLLETASLSILMARRHKSDDTRKKELQARNDKQLQEKSEKDKKDPKKKEPEDAPTELSELELVPLKGTAFKLARQVLWSVCPVADHQAPPGAKATAYLNALVTNHSEGMYNVFGSFVKAKHAPPELVMKHLACLCSLPEVEAGLLAVKPGSILHDDLKGCWAYFSDSLYSLEAPEVKEALASLKGLPCVAVHSEDVADRPVEEMLLTLPQYAFFQLPLLRGKEANLRLYLRQVQTDGPREASVFRAFGAAERPGAADYARASQRVADRASKLGRAGWEWIVACLEACVRGFHEDVLHKRTEGVEIKVENLHMFTKDGKVEVTTQLVWADVPRWLNRCTDTGGALKICSLKGDDQREIAKTLVECAGLRELSALVEERRIMDDAGDQGNVMALEEDVAQEDEVSKRFKKSVQQLLQSFEFANGLCAVIRHTQTQNNQTCNTPAEVRQELRKILFKVSRRRLRSALFWKPKETTRHAHMLVRSEPSPGWVCNGCRKDSDANQGMVRFRCKEGCDFDLCVECYSQTQRAIPGSEQDQQIYFDEAERCVYIRGKERTGDGKEIEDLSSEMVFSLRRALPLLYQVDSFLLEALLGCGLRDGAGGIQGFLEKRDIKVVGLATQEDHLGPGKALPPDLEKRLAWSMDATFGEGETAAVLIKDVFTIVEVASWPMGKEPPAGSGLSRSYRVRISGAMDESAYQTSKHFEIYKIPVDADTPAAAPESMELEVLGTARDVVDEDKGAGGTTEEDEKKIADFKKYLHEMSDMPPDEYKAVMRRLFKTWHPDRAGDTPLSNRIFRMLRSHEQWYKKKQNGEACGDWNDEEGDKGTVVVAEGEMKALPAPEREYVPAEGGQSSWFDEFESEMRNKKPGVTAPSSKVMARPPEKPEYGPSAEPDEFDDEKGDDGHVPKEVAPPAHMQRSEDTSMMVGPGRIVDRQQAPIWLQQAKLEMLTAKKLFEAFEGYRSLPAAAVWHCEQVVEMAIKAAMYRTCGVSEDEAIGGSAHDIAEFVRRLRGADAQTDEQRKAQLVPVDQDDIAWLKKAYLASRYPRPGDYRVPSENYRKEDAERAVKLAEATLAWAADVEDLPDPGISRNTQEDEAQTVMDIRKRRWADMVGTSATATEAEKAGLRGAVPEWKAPAGMKFVAPPAKGPTLVVPKAKQGGAPEVKAGGPSPSGPPKAFGAPSGPPPKAVVPPSWGTPPAADAAADAPGEAAPGNRWKRHQAAGSTAAAAPAAAGQGSADGGEKRGSYEGRVADLKERLKMRKQGKAGAP